MLRNSILKNKTRSETKEHEGKYRQINSWPELRTGANKWEIKQ